MVKRNLSVAVFLSICRSLGNAANCAPLDTAKSVASGANLTGKVAIVTGGDGGLGYPSAEALAKQGATVVIASRHPGKAAKRIADATGANVQGLVLDLSSFASVRSFVDQFHDMFGSKLHLLINNAGVFDALGDSNTTDGYSLTFQTNYLGHFLLTELLLPALRASRPSRVVNVASTMHEVGCRMAFLSGLISPENCVRDWRYLPPPIMNQLIPFPFVCPRPYYRFHKMLYGFTKFLQIQHAAELARREAANGVEAVSVCPGLAEGMAKAVPCIPRVACIVGTTPLGSLQNYHQSPCPYSNEQGAAVHVWAATHPIRSGAFYARYSGCEERHVPMHGMTEQMSHELYNKSRQWSGLVQASRMPTVNIVTPNFLHTLV